MKFKEFKHEPVKPDTYEASMARNQLMRIGKHAIKLHNMIDDNAEMESWVASKIDLAGDYVKKVYNYTEGEKAGLYDDGGMSEMKKMPKGTGTMQGVKEDAGEKIANMAQNMTKDEFMSQADELGLTPKEAAEYYEKMQGGAYAHKFEDPIGTFNFEKQDEYDDNEDKYGDVDKTPLTPQERQQFKQWLMDTANDYAGRALEDGVEEIGDDLSDIEDQYHKFIPKIKQFLKQSHAKGNLENFASDVLNVEEKFGDEDMLMNDEGYRVAKDFSQHATNYEVFIKYASGDYTVKTIRGVLDSIDDDPHISSAMLVFQTDFEGTPLQRKVSRVQASESVSEDAGEGHMSKSTLYHTAKYAIALMDMIKPGDDLEGWVQSKLNKAADYLQGVYNYEEYQKLNPYREELEPALMQRHAEVVQKNIDEILQKETKLDDIDTKPGMMRILAKRVNEVEKEIAKETRKKTDESGIMYRAGVKKYGKKGMTAIQSAAGKGASHQEIGKIKDKYVKDDEQVDEGLKDWARNIAAAGVIVGAVAGMGSINNAIDNSIPAVKAMNTAYEMAIDSGNTELAKNIKNDLSAVKVRLDSGRDLNFVKSMQEKYSKFMPTEGLAYESKLAVLLNQRLK